MGSTDGEHAAEPFPSGYGPAHANILAAMRYAQNMYGSGILSMDEFRARMGGDCTPAWLMPGEQVCRPYAAGGVIAQPPGRPYDYLAALGPLPGCAAGISRYPQPGSGQGGGGSLQPGGGASGSPGLPPSGGSGGASVVHVTGGRGGASGIGGAGGGGGSSFTSYPPYSTEPEEKEPAVAPGSVTGYRWWTLPSPDWRTDPGRAEETWPHGRLHGVQDDWQPGVNIARCRGGHDHRAPTKGCYCGFWAYWQPEQRGMGGYEKSVPVFGAIRAWGRVRTAERGFRAEKAQILAVHLPFVLGPRPEPRSGWHDVFEAYPAVPLTPAQADLAEAWIATAGDRLEADYGVRVFETRNLLLAEYPPDPLYGHRGVPGFCPHCGGNPAVPGGHDPACRDARR